MQTATEVLLDPEKSRLLRKGTRQSDGISGGGRQTGLSHLAGESNDHDLPLCHEHSRFS